MSEESVIKASLEKVMREMAPQWMLDWRTTYGDYFHEGLTKEEELVAMAGAVGLKLSTEGLVTFVYEPGNATRYEGAFLHVHRSGMKIIATTDGVALDNNGRCSTHIVLFNCGNKSMELVGGLLVPGYIASKLDLTHHDGAVLGELINWVGLWNQKSHGKETTDE